MTSSIEKGTHVPDECNQNQWKIGLATFSVDAAPISEFVPWVSSVKMLFSCLNSEGAESDWEYIKSEWIRSLNWVDGLLPSDTSFWLDVVSIWIGVKGTLFAGDSFSDNEHWSEGQDAGSLLSAIGFRSFSSFENLIGGLMSLDDVSYSYSCCDVFETNVLFLGTGRIADWGTEDKFGAKESGGSWPNFDHSYAKEWKIRAQVRVGNLIFEKNVDINNNQQTGIGRGEMKERNTIHKNTRKQKIQQWNQKIK